MKPVVKRELFGLTGVMGLSPSRSASGSIGCVKHVPTSLPVSRRSLLIQGASLFGALGAVACAKGPPSSCNDVSSLTTDQQTTRTTLGYSDASPEPGKSCTKCNQYVPSPKIEECSTCKVLPGPVHPNGYCRAFTPKA